MVLSKESAMQDWARTSGLSRSGFPAAFAIIFVSEIGDKTFFIAALLAMKVRRSLAVLWPRVAGPVVPSHCSRNLYRKAI